MLKNLEKPLWPSFTKGQMIEWYRAVAPALLPHLAGRAVTLARFPDGVEGPGWYQSNCPQGAARTTIVTGPSGKTVRYCLIDDLAALLWAANLGTIEFHPFLAPATTPDRPHALMLDLDPRAPAGLTECCAVALHLRAKLRPLESFVKTSGAKGLHLYVPLNGSATYAQTKPFARELARAIAAQLPDLVTDMPSKAQGAGKVYLDWGQNDANRSTIAPWSLRATRVPLVSMPLRWEELSSEPRKLAFTPETALDRLRRDGDLFRPVVELVQRL
ncbi:MAG TPA: non-homologous end-joining DNA ligase [Myxococcales bacterium]|nr:non-homologous end-joining DNA ligase [Myxococcales bacterium]